MRATLTPPPPMPAVAAAQVHLNDLEKATERAKAAWSMNQLEDALRSARFFLENAEQALAQARRKGNV